MTRKLILLLLVLTFHTAHTQGYPIPDQFEKLRNDPEPFDSSGTGIYFSLTNQCYIQLWIDDSLDTHITYLVDQEMQPGYHVVFWRAKNDSNVLVSPGTYICNLLATSAGDTLFSDSLYIHLRYEITIVESNVNQLPKQLKLYQNYPNPFNPNTTIEFQLPQEIKVELILYNLSGAKVRTLVNNSKPAGYHKVIWNGQNESELLVPSGIYWAKMTAGDYKKTIKMSLIK